MVLNSVDKYLVNSSSQLFQVEYFVAEICMMAYYHHMFYKIGLVWKFETWQKGRSATVDSLTPDQCTSIIFRF